jgi:hypothetical protein
MTITVGVEKIPLHKGDVQFVVAGRKEVPWRKQQDRNVRHAEVPLGNASWLAAMAVQGNTGEKRQNKGHGEYHLG